MHARRACGQVCLLIVAICATAEAYFLDRDETAQLLARAYSQGAIRTADSFGFTFPTTHAGHLIQHRNLLELELAHDVDRLLPTRPAWLNGLAYRLRYKGVYEGVYDYGATEFSDNLEGMPPNPFAPPTAPDSRTVNRTRFNRRTLGTQDELWNGYAQGSAGPLFLRIGRQDLSWGETDGFRLLDMIEPLDNRFGFALVEDLDDRRIPLSMARATLALPWRSVWLTNLTLDSFLAPGAIESQEAPLSPRGSPFAVPAPPSFLSLLVTRPEHAMDGSRGGGRLIGTLFRTATVSLAHYVTWNDSPATRLRVLGVDIIDGKPIPRAALEVAFYQQQITGGSSTMQITDFDAVLRAEAAMFWDERVFDPARAGLGPRFSATINEAIADRIAGGPGAAAGTFTKRDVLRWVIGVDRVVWIRPLNPTNVFSLSAQFFHTHIFDHSAAIRNGILDPVTNDFVARKEGEYTVTFLGRSLFWRGRLEPSVFGAYDPRGVLSIVPGLSLLIGTHVRLSAKYAFIDGNFANLGFFRDRDEVIMRFEVSL